MASISLSEERDFADDCADSSKCLTAAIVLVESLLLLSLKTIRTVSDEPD